MRGVIVGFGTIATGHAVGYSQVDDLSIVGVVDVSPQRRAVAERDFGLRAYASMEEMLACESPDFIDICSPPNTHLSYIRLGLDLNMHVLCEKPVFLPTADGYDRLAAEIVGAKRIVYPCHNYKFAPILAMMQDVVFAPDFGQVVGAHFRTLRRGHAVGVAEWDPHWRRNRPISGGGVLRDHGPHSIYLATHLTGRTPVAVSCLIGNVQRDGYEDTEDTALLTIKCDGGVQITLTLSWSAGYRNSYYAIMGSNGSIVVENDDVCYATCGRVTRTELRSDFDDPSHKDWFRRMFIDFLDMIENPHRQADLVREAIMTSIVIDESYRSARAGGRWVELDIPAVASRAVPA